jgi:hypothetical protein
MPSHVHTRLSADAPDSAARLDASHHARQLRAARIASLFLVSMCCALAPQPAAAFCRESAESDKQGDCIEAPVAPLLFWKRSCITYSFNEHFFTHMTRLNEDQTRAIFRASFATWAAVECQGRAPFFVEQARDTTSTDRAEFHYDAPNEMVINAVPADDWTSRPDHSQLAIALTSLWLDIKTGEILDADMDLNLGIGRFTDCGENACAPGSVDLQNTITHEAGHVLGLGHSRSVGSTMEKETNNGAREISKRSLEPDDIAGYCDLPLPSWTCKGANCRCPPPPVNPSTVTIHGCGCHIAGTESGPWWFGTVVFTACVLFTARRRRASPRPDSVATACGTSDRGTCPQSVMAAPHFAKGRP